MTVNVRKRQRYTIKRVSHVPAVTAKQQGISAPRRLYLLLTAISAAGALTGALSYGRECGFSPAEPVSFGSDFAGSLAVMLLYSGICFFGGLSCAGEPVGLLICFFKGMGTGYLAASVRGAGVACALGVLPFEAVSTVTVILAARENIRLSRYISGRAFGTAEADSSGCLKLYFAKFGVILLASAGAALLDGLMSVLGQALA